MGQINAKQEVSTPDAPASGYDKLYPTVDGWVHLDDGGLARVLVEVGSSPSLTQITLANTGLHILDIDASHDLIIKPGSSLTADRTLTIATGDADRTLTIEANSALNQDLTTDAGVVFGGMTVNGNVVATGSVAVGGTNPVAGAALDLSLIHI